MPYERLDLNSCLYTTLIIDGVDPGRHILLAVHRQIKFPINIYFPAGNHSNKKLCIIQVPFSKAAEVLKLNDSTIKGRTVKVYYPNENPKVLKYTKWVTEFGRKDLVNAMTFDPSPIPAHLKVTADLSGDMVDVGYDLTHPVAMARVDETLMKAKAQGIRWINIPGSSFKNMERAIKLIEDYKEIFPIYFSAGIHPRYEYTCCNTEAMVKELEDIYKHPRCLSAGLIGLDYRQIVGKHTSFDGQKAVFEKQMELACKYKKPVFLVQYEAHEDFMEIISRFQDNLPPCAMFDFEQKMSAELFKQYSEMGFYFALNGYNNTFRKELSPNISRKIGNRTLKLPKILLASHGPMSGKNPDICRYYETSFLKHSAPGDYSFPCDVIQLRENLLSTTQFYLLYKDMNEEELTKILRENYEGFFGFHEESRGDNCTVELQSEEVDALLEEEVVGLQEEEVDGLQEEEVDSNMLVSRNRSPRYFDTVKFFILNLSLYAILLYALYYLMHFII